MTRILANNDGSQMIFETVKAVAAHFVTSQSVIYYKIDSGKPIGDGKGLWWLDNLFEGG